MAIVSKPDKETITLYDIPDTELTKYLIPADKAAQMFPKKDKPTRADAIGVASASSSEADVQAYGANPHICYYWCCDHHGCGWCWYYC